MKNISKNFLTGAVILSFVFGLTILSAYAKSENPEDKVRGKSEIKTVKILKKKTKSDDIKAKVVKKEIEIEKEKSGKSNRERIKEKTKQAIKSKSEVKNGFYEVKGAVHEVDLSAETIILTLTKKNNKLGLKKGDEQKFSVADNAVLRVQDVKLNLDEVVAGMLVEAKARKSGDALTLNRLEVKQKRFEIQGYVKAVNSGVREIKVTVSRAENLPETVNKDIDIKVVKNAKITKNDEPKTFETLVVNDRLNLKIFKAGDKIFAFRIVVREGNQGTEEASSTTTPPTATTTPPTAATTTISITSSGFSPSTVEITKGSKVVFVNNDTVLHQPSSDPHPAHTDFPTFGTGAALNTGESFEFTFNSEMTFRYHDHLNVGLTGIIIVK